MIIWTEAYIPFIAGGDVNAPIGYEATVYVEVTLEGIELCIVQTPLTKPTYVVAEKHSGAIAGTNVAEVIADIVKADRQIVAKQLAELLERRKKVNVLGSAEFWNRYARAK